MRSWAGLNEKILKHPVISGLLVAAIVGLVGLVWTNPLSTSSTPAQLGTASRPATCESIDRSEKGVLSQPIFDIKERMYLMQNEEGRTPLEVSNFLRQYDGIWTIDCGYVTDTFRHLHWIGVQFSDFPEMGSFRTAYCLFDETWEQKILSLSRGQLAMFAGVVSVGSIDALRLRDCRILSIL